MIGVDDRTEALIGKFSKELEESLGGRLLSVVLYGSAARGDFQPGKSDLNFMVVVDDLDFEVLKNVAGKVRRFWRKRISTPLVVDEYYIQRSLDVFPLEFSEMRSAYKVVYGKDPLADLKIEDSDLRLQCEAEIKRKLLLLREAYLDAHNKKGAMEYVLRESYKSFIVVLRNLLPLLGEKAGSNAEVIERAEKIIGVELKSFRRVMQVRKGGIKLSKEERDNLISQYLAEVRSMARAVDSLHEQKAGGD